MKLQIGTAIAFSFNIDDSEETTRDTETGKRRFILHGYALIPEDAKRKENYRNVEILISEDEANMLEINLGHLLARD